MYSDLREWIEAMDELGELKRINAEIDPVEEMASLVYMVGKTNNPPALLFENIKGGEDGRVLFNMFGNSPRRIAYTLGLDPNTSIREMVLKVKELLKKKEKPRFVKDAPVKENVIYKENIDMTKFPAPKMWPRDGGRYIGTADAIITKDPDSDWVNVGVYRQMVVDKTKVGFYSSPGKDVDIIRKKYWDRGEPCPVVAVYGTDPLLYLIGSLAFPRGENEFEHVAGIKGSFKLIEGEITGLPIPANAEVVIEGYSYPEKTVIEGPFGEFTGYYGRPAEETPYIEVEAVYHRDKPIITSALMAEYPPSDQAFFFGICRAAKIWEDLDKLGILGVKGVYSHPAAAGGFGMTIISLKQLHPGHASQVLSLAAQCPAGAYYSKIIIVVDEDIDPYDINQVIWALATRFSPKDDITVLKDTWSTWLDPTLNPPEIRPWGSKLLLNACKDYKHFDKFSPRNLLRKEVYERVITRWKEFGIEEDPPVVDVFEEES
jgi:4-hydroxy-3-polyprenylbenzoate decarboxylase